jgi:putative SOS response-associated peptidase YedK
MCASYGLDPRFDAEVYAAALDKQLLQTLRAWAESNAGEALRPTGKNLRNLNPLITGPTGAREVTPAWWGFLVQGAPARFPSINTRSERLSEKPATMAQRAIVPATRWFEMRVGDRRWHAFSDGGALLGMAAIARPGRLATGEEYTCYSIVMRPATPAIAGVHDRMPLLIPAGFVDEWLDDSRAPTGQLVDAAVAASAAESERIAAEELAGAPY